MLLFFWNKGKMGGSREITNRKKEERHQHFSSIDITLRSDSLNLNRRWQLKAGVYPKEDNSVRDGGFPTNSSLACPSPSLYCCRPLHPPAYLFYYSQQSKMGRLFSLVIYKAAGGFEAEVYLVVIISIICLKPSDIYLWLPPAR